VVQQHRRRDPGGGDMAELMGTGYYGGPPVAWAPREGAPSRCEHKPRVSEVRRSLAARNRAAAVLPAAAAPREIPGCGAAQRAEGMAGGAPGAKTAILR